MKKLLLIVLTVAFATSCQQKNEKIEAVTVKDSVADAKFQMYEMSEMAALMEQMYAYNTQLKERIITNQDLGSYPVAFDKLHTAVLTEASDRDPFFNDQAIKFIEAQKAIYADPVQAKDNFNKMVNQCLECHSKKCGGPIPRIKKLIIP
mgnify:FL=1